MFVDGDSEKAQKSSAPGGHRIVAIHPPLIEQTDGLTVHLVPPAQALQLGPGVPVLGEHVRPVRVPVVEQRAQLTTPTGLALDPTPLRRPSADARSWSNSALTATKARSEYWCVDGTHPTCEPAIADKISPGPPFRRRSARRHTSQGREVSTMLRIARSTGPLGDRGGVDCVRRRRGRHGQHGNAAGVHGGSAATTSTTALPATTSTSTTVPPTTTTATTAAAAPATSTLPETTTAPLATIASSDLAVQMTAELMAARAGLRELQAHSRLEGLRQGERWRPFGWHWFPCTTTARSTTSTTWCSTATSFGWTIRRSTPSWSSPFGWRSRAPARRSPCASRRAWPRSRRPRRTVARDLAGSSGFRVRCRYQHTRRADRRRLAADTAAAVADRHAASHVDVARRSPATFALHPWGKGRRHRDRVARLATVTATVLALAACSGDDGTDDTRPRRRRRRQRRRPPARPRPRAPPARPRPPLRQRQPPPPPRLRHRWKT